jgi:hypothetical protein
MPRWSLLLALLAAGCARPPAAPAQPAGVGVMDAPVRTASDFVALARARYSATWYRTLTFVQTTTFHTPEGAREETWYEAARIPGRLRIDLPELGAGNVALFRGDSTYVFREGEQVVARPEGNPLVLLAFDLYRLPTAETLAGMARLGIDTTVVHADTWGGRPMWVIGAAEGDTTAPQVWYDRERLVFVRLIEREDDGPGPDVTDIRFERYEPLAGGWIAPRVEVFSDGRLVMTEDYRDVRADVPLDDAVFSPARWRDVRWWEE